jgi:predicted DNA-binding transcriptional regulator AlpA
MNSQASSAASINKRMPVVSAERALRDVSWLSRQLGVSKSWVYQACASGVVPCVRIGALLRFDPAVIRAWLASGQVPTSAKSIKIPSCR